MAKKFASQPAPQGVEASTESLPDITPKAFFDLACHPRQWSFVEVSDGVFEWLPDFTKIPYRAGVNAAIFGDVKQADGSIKKVIKNLAEVRMLRQGKGYRFLPRDTEAGDYLSILKTRTGDHYHLAWERFEYADGFGVQRSVDNGAKLAFQRALIEHAIVSAPPEVYRQKALKAARGEAQRWAAAPKSEAQAQALAAANAKLKAMESIPLPVPGKADVDAKAPAKGKASK